MKRDYKEIIRNAPVYEVYRRWRSHRLERKALQLWEKSGRPVPPPHVVKERAVKSYGRRFGLQVFVETGTYLGDMVDAIKWRFPEIYPIELGEDLHKNACLRFARYKHVRLLQGDSAKMLRELLPKLNRSPLIGLDPHFSGGSTVRGDGETPIVEELETIFNQKHIDPVILIDDARLFDGINGYPTCEELKEMARQRRAAWLFGVSDDIIRLHGPGPAC